MACRFIGTDMGLEDLAGSRILAYGSWPWLVRSAISASGAVLLGETRTESDHGAFEAKRRTLYQWRKQFRDGKEGIESLNEKSRAPRKRRKRLWPKAISEEIGRLRKEHPNLGKEKIYPFLKVFCEARKLSCPRPRTIGRLIADQADKMRIRPIKLGPKGQRIERKKTRKGRKPKGYKASAPGECGAFDTVEYFLDGIRRYVITFTYHYSRFAFAWATQSHASLAAREFFDIVLEVFPYPLQSLPTMGLRS